MYLTGSFLIEHMRVRYSVLYYILLIVCIDDTSSSHKWTKKAQKQLEKLNNHSNCTAGLKDELLQAVGACVMLQRNIDTKQGLANGAFGTVSLYPVTN